MAPYPYEQPFNHHLYFDPNLQQSDGLNVTGLMRIMPFVSDDRGGEGGGEVGRRKSGIDLHVRQMCT